MRSLPDDDALTMLVIFVFMDTRLPKRRHKAAIVGTSTCGALDNVVADCDVVFRLWKVVPSKAVRQQRPPPITIT